MPLIYSKEINESAKIGIWKIDETLDTLKTLFFENKCPGAPVDISGHELRVKQQLSSVIMVNNLLVLKGVAIQYNNQAPVLTHTDWNLSISHSGVMVACILDKNNEPGIDIERIHPRIEKIASRFMHKTEQEFIDHATRLEQLTVIWCAKESLYKIYKKGGLIFKEDIIISPFVYEKMGLIQGEIRTRSISSQYRLAYETMGDYMLVHSLSK